MKKVNPSALIRFAPPDENVIPPPFRLIHPAAQGERCAAIQLTVMPLQYVPCRQSSSCRQGPRIRVIAGPADPWGGNKGHDRRKLGLIRIGGCPPAQARHCGRAGGRRTLTRLAPDRKNRQLVSERLRVDSNHVTLRRYLCLTGVRRRSRK